MSVTKVALAAAAGGGRSRGGPNVRGPSDAPLSWKIFPAERDTYPARTAAASPSQNTHSRRFTHTLTHTLSTHTLTHTLYTHTLILTHTSINTHKTHIDKLRASSAERSLPSRKKRG